jgi:3-oxoacyl-[acyl-carrier-protein] synthase-3
MTNAVEQIIQRNKIDPQNISYLVPHQANKRIIDAIAKRIGLADDKVMSNIEYFGNTTAATLPLLLKDYESKLSPGDQLVFAAFGGGFTWGAAYLTWAY